MPTSSPRIAAEKPPIPTLWLDTSVIVKLAKLQVGERLSAVEVARLTLLRDTLRPLVHGRKVLCVQSGQYEEVEARRLDAHIRQVLVTISSGISLMHRQGIRDNHIFLAITAYVSGDDLVRLPYRSYFRRDPIAELEQTRRSRIIVDAYTPMPPSLVRHRREMRRQIHKEWEELRRDFVTSRRTFAEQVHREKKGHADVAVEMVRAFWTTLLKDGVWDEMAYYGVYGWLKYQQYLTHFLMHKATLDDLHAFLSSDYYNNLPFRDIECKLASDLVVRPRPVQSGDSMDVELLQTVIPLAHFVVADKDMVDRVQRLGIDKDWNTKVYSMRTVEHLISELCRIGDEAAKVQTTQ